MNYDVNQGKVQAKALSQEVAKRLEDYVGPLVKGLDKLLDKRLVRTFVALIEVIIRFRGYRHGLLLSELGGYLMPPGQAPAGTKRLSNLLHGQWSYKLIETFLWQSAKAR